MTPTTTVTAHSSTCNSTSIFGQWLTNAWTLFKQAPFTLIVLVIASMIISGVFQAIPGALGILVSKYVGAMLIFVMWPMLDQIKRTKRLSFKNLGHYSGWKYMPIMALLFMLPFAVNVLTASMILGDSAMDLMFNGNIANVSATQMGLIFASGAIPLVLLSFVAPLIMLGNQTMVDATCKGLQMFAKAHKPMLIVLAIQMLSLFFAPHTFALSALLVAPLMLCLNYQAFHYLRAEK
ncbi:hypothetical protein ACFO4O_00925 [Glaciecola siphonariae]|uniref:Uncharacterized protein n=1 Tax=Glaciecola siphonariae TaxID=521012 RepID=A0ABV9LQE1_9ALTE